MSEILKIFREGKVTGFVMNTIGHFSGAITFEGGYVSFKGEFRRNELDALDSLDVDVVVTNDQRFDRHLVMHGVFDGAPEIGFSIDGQPCIRIPRFTGGKMENGRGDGIGYEVILDLIPGGKGSISIEQI